MNDFLNYLAACWKYLTDGYGIAPEGYEWFLVTVFVVVGIVFLRGQLNYRNGRWRGQEEGRAFERGLQETREAGLLEGLTKDVQEELRTEVLDELRKEMLAEVEQAREAGRAEGRAEAWAESQHRTKVRADALKAAHRQGREEGWMAAKRGHPHPPP